MKARAMPDMRAVLLGPRSALQKKTAEDAAPNDAVAHGQLRPSLPDVGPGAGRENDDVLGPLNGAGAHGPSPATTHAPITPAAHAHSSTDAKALNSAGAHGPSPATTHAPSDALAQLPSLPTPHVQNTTGAQAANSAGAHGPRSATAHAPSDASAQSPIAPAAHAHSGASAGRGSAPAQVPHRPIAQAPMGAIETAVEEGGVDDRSGHDPTHGNIDPSAHAQLRVSPAMEGQGPEAPRGAPPRPPRKRPQAAASSSAPATPLPREGKKRQSTGSLRNPYARKDGVKVVNVTLSLPADLAQEWREFCARLPPGARSEWTAQWLTYAMRWQGDMPPEA
jgi:hypothetical protein